MRIHTLRGTKVAESALGSKDARARPAMRVVEEGLETAAVAVGANAGAIYVGPRIDALQSVAAFGPGAKDVLDIGAPRNIAIAQRALRKNDPLRCTDPRPDPHFKDGARRVSRGVLLGPLRDGAKTLGLLQLVKTDGRFGERDARIVGALTTQITTALVQTASLRHQELLAAHDPLTGLRNVRELDSELSRAIGAARRRQRDMALMFVDVDHLKRVNSKFGHAAGSEALRRTGKALDEAAAGVSSVFRFGGDEFVVVQRRASKESARALADHLRSHVAASTGGPMRPQGDLPKITVSVGVATLKGLRLLNGQPPAEIRARLMATADRALFRAKAAGRNRVILATARDDRL
ncbi:MAG: sensor domain-containing diguanylate cyclase [Myxococcota bacterium]